MRKKQNNAILNSVEVKVEVGVELGKKHIPIKRILHKNTHRKKNFPSKTLKAFSTKSGANIFVSVRCLVE